MTFARAMRTAPRVNVRVVIIGRNSGVSPTASAVAKSSDSSGSRRNTDMTTMTNRTRKTTVFRMRTPNCTRPRSNSDGGGRRVRSLAMDPNSVRGPVAVTRAMAFPLTTDEPIDTAWPPPLTSFSTGRDSPVRAASLTWRSLASSNLASAGTISPAESRMTSPGTTQRRAISFQTPSRRTEAVCATCAFNASAARSERRVCTNSTAMLTAMIARTTSAFTTSRRAAETTHATMRIRTSGLVKR